LKAEVSLYLIYPHIIIIGEILVLFIYITRLASNEIFSPPNKTHREVGQAKDISAPLYKLGYRSQNVQFYFHQNQGIFLFSKVSRPAPGHTQPPI
jgi:hypothetical protein